MGQRRTEEARPFIEEADQVFERLEGRPWLERVAQAQAARVAASS